MDDFLSFFLSWKDNFVFNNEYWQEQECDEKYKKTCTIAFEDVAKDEELEVCRANLVKNCQEEGPVECTTVYETECTTYQKVHDVEDDVTNCETVYEEKCKDVTLGKIQLFFYENVCICNICH